MALFETPTQVRQRLYQNAYTMGAPIMGGGLFAPAYQGIGKIGTGLGAMVGIANNPEVQRQQRIQEIQQKTFAGMQPDEFPTRLPQFASSLAEGGYVGEAFKVLGYAKELGVSEGMSVSKETQDLIRKNIDTNRTKLEEKAAGMVDTMKSIDALAAEAAGGNRSARGVMVQKLARLAQGAGVITDRDAAAVTGDQSGFAFLLSAILPKVDADTKAALRGIDPLGAGFEVNNLLKVADKLLTSGQSTIKNRMSDLKSMGTDARLGEQDMKALFSGTSNINSLYDLDRYEYKVENGQLYRRKI